MRPQVVAAGNADARRMMGWVRTIMIALNGLFLDSD